KMNLVFGSYGQTWHLPVPIALILIVGVLAPAFGWGLDTILFRKLREAGSVVRIVATIGVLIALEGLAALIWGTTSKLTPKYFFPTHVFHVGGFTAPAQHILAILLTLGLALGLVAFLKFSPLGVKLRAVVDRPAVSRLRGLPSPA